MGAPSLSPRVSHKRPPAPRIPTICFILILQHSKLWYPWGSLKIAMVQKI